MINSRDSNTWYFYATTKGRRAKNRFSVIEDENGVPCFEEEKNLYDYC